MEKEKIISIAAAAVSVAALGLAIVTAGTVDKTKKSVSFDTAVSVATAGGVSAPTDGEGEAAEGEEAAATESTEQDAASPASSAYTGSTNIILEDGVIKLSNSVIKVPAPGTNGNEDVNNVYLYMPGTNVATYDSTTGYLILNSTTVVRTINAIDATYNGISKFDNESGETVLIGEKVIDDTTAIAVVHTVPGSIGANIDLEAETKIVQDLLDGTFADVTITSASLFGYSINPEWVENMIIADEGLELIKGTKAIYVTPYTGTFASGTTNTLNAGQVSLTYSDNIHDDSTGYTPYILNYSEAQDGSSSSSTTTLQAKILSKSNLEITDLFTSK